MTLQFILGTAAADHRQVLLGQMREVLTNDVKARIFYLVPNHIKFEAEVSLLKGLAQGAKTYAQSRVQTLSFSRLAWYFLKNDAIYQQPRLDTAMNTMLVAKLLHDNHDDLVVYREEAQHAGFISDLAKQLQELSSGRVDADTLDQLVAQMTPGDRKRPKMQDLALLLRRYQGLIGPYITNPSLLAALSAKLSQHPENLAHTYFFLNHFNDFNASEAQLVATLMQQSHVQIALTLDQPARDALPTAPALFLPAAKVYRQLYQRARDQGVWCGPDIFAPKRQLSAGMAGFAAQFDAQTRLQKPAFVPEVQAQIELAKAPDVYGELREVALKISQSVHQGAHYRDFLVIARHLDPYLSALAPTFHEFELPVFIDLEHSMQTHPLVALLDSIFAILNRNFQYSDVMRFLRTELALPANMEKADFRSAVDIFDNHLLRTDISGLSRYQQQNWQYFRRSAASSEDSDGEADVETSSDPNAKNNQAINTIRQFVADSFLPLKAAFKKAQSGKEAAEALYQWLLKLGVVDQLSAWRDAAEKKGELAQAQAGEQAFQTFCDLLDDYVQIWGDLPFDAEQFQQLLAAGFAGATYTQIPSTLDQVTVSETALTRLNRYQHVFVIGATSAAMPDTPQAQGVLTETDRQQLSEFLAQAKPDAYLPVQGSQTTLGDPFINYLGIMSASEKLTMSYPVYDVRENKPSPYLEQLAQAMHLKVGSWSGVTLSTVPQDRIGSKRSLLADATMAAGLFQGAKRLQDPAWQAVWRLLAQDANWGGLAGMLETSTAEMNAVGKLDPALARQLYGRELQVSVSRLETYYRNPFEYFLKYGLRLSKRPEFELTPADTGSLYHAVMDHFISKRKDLTSLTADQIHAAVQQLVGEFAQQPGYEILTANAHMQYIQQQTVVMLSTVLEAIAKQQKQSRFVPRATELTFGPAQSKNTLAALHLPLGADASVTVRGKIDRLDVAQAGGQQYFLIVDYKSSTHVFDPEMAYYGIAMQMLTYVDAAQTSFWASGEPLEPAGALYFMFHQPKLDYKAGQDQEAIALATLKDYKMKGFLVLPENTQTADDLIEAFDSNFANHGAGNSLLVPLGVTTKGALAKNTTNALTPDQLTLFMHHNRRQIVKAAGDILAGNIDLAPIQFNHEATVITSSDYQSIMRFDPATGFDHYHHVRPLSKADVLEKLAEEAEEENPDD